MLACREDGLNAALILGFANALLGRRDASSWKHQKPALALPVALLSFPHLI
jgi:hypothetical protein